MLYIFCEVTRHLKVAPCSKGFGTVTACKEAEELQQRSCFPELYLEDSMNDIYDYKVWYGKLKSNLSLPLSKKNHKMKQSWSLQLCM